MAIRLTIGKKIIGGFLVGLLITLVIGGMGLYGILTIDKALVYMGADRIPGLDALQNMDVQRSLIRSYRYEIITTESEPTRIQDLQQIKAHYEESFKVMDNNWNKFAAIPRATDEGKRLLGNLSAQYQAWHEYCRLVLDSYIDPLIQTPEGPDLESLYYRYAHDMNRINKYSEAFENALRAMHDQNNEITMRVIEKNEHLGTLLMRITIVVIVIGTAAAMGLGIYITQRITRPIKNAFDLLKAMADGDLAQEFFISSNDEIGDMIQLMNQTQDGIKHLLMVIKERAQNLTAVGSELSGMTIETAAAINQLSGNTKSIQEKAEKQYDSAVKNNDTMGKITKSIEELNTSIEHLAENSARSSAAIQEMVANIGSVTQTLGKNEENVRKLAAASEKGRGGLQEVSHDIQDVSRESEGLVEINAVMQNIASQTNLLSMNAAIEAAHAGEAGKGFAVVADEIRKLAESSSQQAQTVSAVLKKIKESVDHISSATQIVLNNFEDIDTGVKTVSSQTEHIKNAMEEQDRGSREILEAVDTLDEVTKNVRHSSGEMAGRSHEIIGGERHLMMLSREVSAGVTDMSVGIGQINVTTERIQGIGRTNKQNIEALITELEKFKVD
ncbi:MAG: methyl-accepting chemotaxis protein [Treponema sp.]|jgi:methyl-accepting chemotaxis protein|nr:methyl-accepting chemotaxis protein [Treponema sp.]